MRKTIGILLALGLLVATIQGADTTIPPAAKKSGPVSLLLRAGYFMPSETEFKNIYGSGPVFGAELRFGKKQLAGWLEGSFFSRSGELSYTLEETKVTIMSVEGGALWRFKTEKIAPYIGAGVGYYQFKETSDALGEAKQSKAGFCGIAGATLTLGKSLLFDCRLKYNSCSVEPADYKIKIGGLTAGIGLGIRF